MFEATGVVPFNPNRIDKQKLKPSQALSIEGNFPVEQPLVIRTIMAAFGTLPLPSPPHLPPLNGEGTLMQVDPGLEKLSMPQRQPVLTSAEYTVSSRWRNCQQALLASKDTSHLLSSSAITAAQVNMLNPAPTIEHIPVWMYPDWSIIQDPHTSAEALHAQLAKVMDYTAALQTSS